MNEKARHKGSDSNRGLANTTVKPKALISVRIVYTAVHTSVQEKVLWREISLLGLQ
jgi:hypothetical protein